MIQIQSNVAYTSVFNSQQWTTKIVKFVFSLSYQKFKYFHQVKNKTAPKKIPFISPIILNWFNLLVMLSKEGKYWTVRGKSLNLLNVEEKLNKFKAGS